MKAYRITRNSAIQPLPFTANHRKGDLPAENARRQAAGEIPRPIAADFRPAGFMRTIVLEEGRFDDFASAQGSLLSFVISGRLTLTTGNGTTATLSPGDMVLVDDESAASIAADASDACRLIQIDVAPDWPDTPDAQVQDEGTLNPRAEITLKRIRKGNDDRSYFQDFPELFAAPINRWSAPRPVTGFRFMCWEDGCFDWHPEVVNHFGIVLAGELLVEASSDHVSHVFRAGDVLSAEDRTGMGHRNRSIGKIYVALVQLEDEDLW